MDGSGTAEAGRVAEPTGTPVEWFRRRHQRPGGSTVFASDEGVRLVTDDALKIDAGRRDEEPE